MTIGSGIFMGALCLALVFLYTGTKDRWRWKRIAIWIVAVSVAMGAALAGYIYYVDNKKEPVVPQVSLLGVKVGMKPEDVLFNRGQPSKKQGDDWFYAGMSSGTTDDLGLLQVRYRNNKVEWVGYHGANTLLGPGVLGVGLGERYERLVELLGEPTDLSISSDGLKRMVTYRKLNAFYELEAGAVIGYGVAREGYGKVSYMQEWGSPSAAASGASAAAP